MKTSLSFLFTTSQHFQERLLPSPSSCFLALAGFTFFPSSTHLTIAFFDSSKQNISVVGINFGSCAIACLFGCLLACSVDRHSFVQTILFLECQWKSFLVTDIKVRFSLLCALVTFSSKTGRVHKCFGISGLFLWRNHVGFGLKKTR